MSYTPEAHHYVPFADVAIGRRYLHSSKGSYVPVTVRAVLPAPSPTDPSTSTSASRGNLVGIEYDDASLGKHSGTLDGAQVFTVRRQGAGSFVKYDDARRKGLYRGWSVVEALMERYGVDIPLAAGGGADRAILKPTSGEVDAAKLANGRAIEMPNMASVARRVSRLDKLQHAGLEGYRIGALVSPGQGGAALEEYLRAHLTSMTSLDMAGCLIHDWAGVEEVVRCSPVLEQVNLSHARIHLGDAGIEERIRFIRGIRVVMMNDCDLQSEDITHLTRLLPRLTRLDIPNNPNMTTKPAYIPSIGTTSDAVEISEATVAETADQVNTRHSRTAGGWGKLEYLNVARTGLAEWDEVRRIVALCPSATLPFLPSKTKTFKGTARILFGKSVLMGRLKTLDLSGTPIRSIPPPAYLRRSIPADKIGELDGAVPLVPLASLIWNQCDLASWSSIDHLRQWTGTTLTSMRYTFRQPGQNAQISDTPISRPIGSDQSLNRALLIASLPSLRTLNGTTITSTERREAEMSYVRYVQQYCSTQGGMQLSDDSAHGEESGRARRAERGREVWGMYEALAAKHGVAERTAGADGTAGSSIVMRGGGAGHEMAGSAQRAGALKSRLITLKIHCPFALPSDPIPPTSLPPTARSSSEISISVLPSTSIPLLRKKLAKALRFPTPEGIKSYTVRVARPSTNTAQPTSELEGERGDKAKAESGRQDEATGVMQDQMDEQGEELEMAAEVNGENVGYWFSDGDTVWVDV